MNSDDAGTFYEGQCELLPQIDVFSIQKRGWLTWLILFTDGALQCKRMHFNTLLWLATYLRSSTPELDRRLVVLRLQLVARCP